MIKDFLILFLLIANFISAQQQNELEKLFSNNTGAFVLYDNTNGKFIKIFEERCRQRMLPASTFKIPNSIIGLESGVIKDENFIIRLDGVKRENKECDKDNSLSSAIKYSVVPYYQELARRVGKEKMQKYLDDINYGNKIIGDGIDAFWLDNSLKISPDEQIEFLKKFYFYKLPVSKRSIDIVKKIMSSEEYPNSIIKYKTGGGQKEDGKWLGWLVGFIEKMKPNKNDEKDVFIFAMNVEGKTFDEVSKLRMEIAKRIFKQLDLI
jgi:beta-lactamase class D